jgi:hypothetical protein
MDVVDNGFTSLQKVSQTWNIPLTSLLDHFTNNVTNLNGVHSFECSSMTCNKIILNF